MESRRWTKLNFVRLVRVLIKIAYIAFIVERPVSFLPSVRSIEETRIESTVNGSVGRLAAEYRKGCPKHRFTSIQFVSREPHMMLIEGFLTEAEAEILVNIAYPLTLCDN